MIRIGPPVAALCAALAITTATAGDVPEPEGYRLENYRAPVPATLRGARVLSTEQARSIWAAGTAVFVDVLPQPPKPRSLPPNTVWRDARRDDIPGSIWLPDTGYGELDPVTDAYLRLGLSQATGGDMRKLVVFYCQEGCWMSWNAAKRALTYGYTNIAWYPEGTDGWQRANLPSAEAHPEPRPGD